MLLNSDGGGSTTTKKKKRGPAPQSSPVAKAAVMRRYTRKNPTLKDTMRADFKPTKKAMKMAAKAMPDLPKHHSSSKSFFNPKAKIDSTQIIDRRKDDPIFEKTRGRLKENYRMDQMAKHDPKLRKYLDKYLKNHPLADDEERSRRFRALMRRAGAKD